MYAAEKEFARGSVMLGATVLPVKQSSFRKGCDMIP